MTAVDLAVRSGILDDPDLAGDVREVSDVEARRPLDPAVIGIIDALRRPAGCARSAARRRLVPLVARASCWPPRGSPPARCWVPSTASACRPASGRASACAGHTTSVSSAPHPRRRRRSGSSAWPAGSPSVSATTGPGRWPSSGRSAPRPGCRWPCRCSRSAPPMSARRCCWCTRRRAARWRWAHSSRWPRRSWPPPASRAWSACPASTAPWSPSGPPGTLEERCTASGVVRPGGGLPAAGRPLREVRLEGARFRYRAGERDAVGPIDLTIPSGAAVALVGANGAGKTTLAKLIMGLHRPIEGRVLVDGMDLADYDQDGWWSNLGVLFQTYGRYPATVTDNIVCGARRRIPDDGVPGTETVDSTVGAARDRVAERLGLAEIVDRLPRGWDTELSTRNRGRHRPLRRAVAADRAGARAVRGRNRRPARRARRADRQPGRSRRGRVLRPLPGAAARQ